MNTDPQRFWSKVDKEAESGHWLWLRCVDRKGYGRIKWLGKNRHAIRVAYELTVGPLSSERHLDHLPICGNKRCVKTISDERGPAHLEPVTLVENVVRANVARGQRFDKYKVFAE